MTDTTPSTEQSELLPCPWCPTTRREIHKTDGDGVVGMIIHDEGCYLVRHEDDRCQILTFRGIIAWNTRSRAAVATPVDAEGEFLAASIAVWREIDRLSALPEGYKGLPPETDPRKRELAAWEAYRSILDATPSLPSVAPIGENET